MTIDLSHFTDEQLEQRVNTVEAWILREKDWKNLPALNDVFQKLIDEQARRDVENEIS